MRGSHSVVTAWADGPPVGLGNALSYGQLVARHEGFHMHILVAAWQALGFFDAGSCGPFTGGTATMWICADGEHRGRENWPG